MVGHARVVRVGARVVGGPDGARRRAAARGRPRRPAGRAAAGEWGWSIAHGVLPAVVTGRSRKASEPRTCGEYRRCLSHGIASSLACDRRARSPCDVAHASRHILGEDAHDTTTRRGGVLALFGCCSLSFCFIFAIAVYVIGVVLPDEDLRQGGRPGQVAGVGARLQLHGLRQARRPRARGSSWAPSAPSIVLSRIPVIGWIVALAALAVTLLAAWRVGLKLQKEAVLAASSTSSSSARLARHPRLRQVAWNTAVAARAVGGNCSSPTRTVWPGIPARPAAAVARPAGSRRYQPPPGYQPRATQPTPPPAGYARRRRRRPATRRRPLRRPRPHRRRTGRRLRAAAAAPRATPRAAAARRPRRPPRRSRRPSRRHPPPAPPASPSRRHATSGEPRPTARRPDPPTTPRLTAGGHRVSGPHCAAG